MLVRAHPWDDSPSIFTLPSNSHHLKTQLFKHAWLSIISDNGRALWYKLSLLYLRAMLPRVKRRGIRIVYAPHYRLEILPSVSPRGYARTIKILMSIRETRRSQSSRHGGIKTWHFLSLSYLRARAHDFVSPRRKPTTPCYASPSLSLSLGCYREDFSKLEGWRINEELWGAAAVVVVAGQLIRVYRRKYMRGRKHRAVIRVATRHRKVFEDTASPAVPSRNGRDVEYMRRYLAILRRILRRCIARASASERARVLKIAGHLASRVCIYEIPRSLDLRDRAINPLPCARKK